MGYDIFFGHLASVIMAYCEVQEFFRSPLYHKAEVGAFNPAPTLIFIGQCAARLFVAYSKWDFIVVDTHVAAPTSHANALIFDDNLIVLL